MVVAIASDLHDNLTNWSVFIQQVHSQGVEEIWLAGDIGTPDTFTNLLNETQLSIKIVPGNVEEGHRLTNYTAITANTDRLLWIDHPPLTWQMEKLGFAMVHHPGDIQKCPPTDVVIYGHTHRPSLEKKDTTWVVNPGTLGGVFFPATYTLATIENDTIFFSLKRLFTGKQ